jgi:hypothetical protein
MIGVALVVRKSSIYTAAVQYERDVIVTKLRCQTNKVLVSGSH